MLLDKIAAAHKHYCRYLSFYGLSGEPSLDQFVGDYGAHIDRFGVVQITVPGGDEHSISDNGLIVRYLPSGYSTSFKIETVKLLD